MEFDEAAGMGNPGEYKLAGYTASLVSTSGTALFDGMTDQEIIDMYHESGTEDTEIPVTEFPWNGSEDVFRKWTNTEYGVIVEDLSLGAHNLTYTVIRDGCVITVMGDYEIKDSLEALVESIRSIDISE